MAQIIPLQSVPSQTLKCVLDGQQCQISVYVKNQCMFLDLIVNGVQVALASQCLTASSIITTGYLGFTGWLTFWDQQGEDDPQYTGLGARWQLVYLDESDWGSNGIA